MKHFLPLFLLFFIVSHANAQTIQVLNIPDGTNNANTSRTWSTDYGYHLNGNNTTSGASMANAKEKLTTTANFGPSGTVPHALNIVDGFATRGSITSLSQLDSYDIIYVGNYYRSASGATGLAFTTGEVDILLQWTKQPGKVLMVQEQNFGGSPVSTHMGYSIVNGSNTNPSTAVPADSQLETNIFSGIFGSASTLNQNGTSQGYFNGDCEGIPLAKNANGLTTILFNTEYRDILIADTDFFTIITPGGGSMTAGGTITSSTDRAWANLWAWAVNEVVNDVNPSASVTTPGTAYSDQNMPLCYGQSAVVKLKDNNATIKRWQTSTNNGATWTNISSTAQSITFSNPANNQQFRAVVQNSAICPEDFSNEVIITTSAQPNAGAGTPSNVGPLCSLSNTGELTVTGHTGVVAEWQTSTNGGTTWTSIPGTNGHTSYTFTNAQNGQQFRIAVASSLSCVQPAPNGDVRYSSVSTISTSAAECCAAGDTAPVLNN